MESENRAQSPAGEAPGPSPLERWGRRALWAWAAFVVFSVAFVPLRASHDEWWHLKTGKWIVESNDWRLPETDVFTYTAADYPWHNHEWATQIGMYLVWRAARAVGWGGWQGVILAKALVLLATYLLLGRFLRLRAGSGWGATALAVFLVVLAVAAGRRTFYPRPPVVSYFLMVFFMVTLWLHRTGRLRTGLPVLTLPVLTGLWANLHGGFLLGGVVVACFFAGEVAEYALLRGVLRRPAESLRPIRARVWTYFATGVLCGLASLLNPFGYHVHLLTFRVMRDAELVSRISELQPPQLAMRWGYALLLALVLAGIAFTAFRALRAAAPRRLPPVADLLLVAFFAQQSLSHVRHLPLFGLAATPFIAWAFAPLLPRIRRAGGALLVAGALAGGVWMVFVPGEAGTLWAVARGEAPRGALSPSNFRRNLWLLQGVEKEPGAYAETAVDFILKARPPGRMFNRDHIAGYLIWRLSPEHYRVFTDQRFDVFGGDFLLDELSVHNAWPEGVLRPRNLPVRDWRDVLDEWNVNWLFLERSSPLHRTLSEGSREAWALIYLDRDWAIWIRRGPPENAAIIARYERGGGARR